MARAEGAPRRIGFVSCSCLLFNVLLIQIYLTLIKIRYMHSVKELAQGKDVYFAFQSRDRRELIKIKKESGNRLVQTSGATFTATVAGLRQLISGKSCIAIVRPKVRQFLYTSAN